MNPKVLEAFEAIQPHHQELIQYYLKALARSGEPAFAASLKLIDEVYMLAQARDPERYRTRDFYYDLRWRERLRRERKRTKKQTATALYRDVRDLKRKGNSVAEACRKLSKQYRRAPGTLKNQFYHELRK